MSPARRRRADDDDDESLVTRIAAALDDDGSGYDISRGLIKRLKQDKQFHRLESLGYGEINIASFGQLLLSTSTTPADGCFVDIGAGTGKACFAAAAVGFAHSLGFEIVPELDAQARKSLESVRDIDAAAAARCEFHLASCFDHEDAWKRASVLFLPVTLFSDDDFAKVQAAVRRTMTRKGAAVLCTSRKLDQCSHLALEQTRSVRLHKGAITVHVYRVV